MASLGSLFDSAKTAGTDLYVVYSTPTLQTAIRKVQDTPVVFTVVADPFLAGAGKSDARPLAECHWRLHAWALIGKWPNCCGIISRQLNGSARCSVLPKPTRSANKDLFVREAARCGLTVETVPANTPGDLPDAALALCSRRLDAVVQVVDNLSAAGFPAIARAAAQAQLPALPARVPASRQGAAVALARDYYDAGRETALKAASIMRGESPARRSRSHPLPNAEVASM